RLPFLSGKAVEHRVLELRHRLLARSEDAPAFAGQGRGQRSPMIRMWVALDQPLALERVDHLTHGLRRHERAPRELRRRERRTVSLEDAERRELERGQPVWCHELR